MAEFSSDLRWMGAPRGNVRDSEAVVVERLHCRRLAPVQPRLRVLVTPSDTLRATCHDASKPVSSRVFSPRLTWSARGRVTCSAA
jgi:hypothetical protein